ncbi:uncharacterized protein LOC125507697 [Triticum urartu]|uniref:uncharacterized protein LOC125507697 n=1 Tax=Triticum urartu TaxID=4572 RepID=UPI0020439DEC|nr:uncharacterized protein LOC125507697 [Triticum urartu]
MTMFFTRHTGCAAGTPYALPRCSRHAALKPSVLSASASRSMSAGCHSSSAGLCSSSTCAFAHGSSCCSTSSLYECGHRDAPARGVCNEGVTQGHGFWCDSMRMRELVVMPNGSTNHGREGREV